MRNKYFKLIFSGLLFFSFPCWSEDAPFNYPDEFDFQPSLIKEAGRAVLGRVFGVEGEGGEIDYHVVELTGHSPRSSAVRSTLVPGWGQSYNGQGGKGAALFLTVSAAALGSYWLYDKADQNYDDYKNLGVKDSNLYDDYSQQRTQALVLGGLAALIWGYTVVDAYQNAYHPLYGREPHVDLALTPREGELRWTKRF